MPLAVWGPATTVESPAVVAKAAATDMDPGILVMPVLVGVELDHGCSPIQGQARDGSLRRCRHRLLPLQVASPVGDL
jgi:hypothetical protein